MYLALIFSIKDFFAFVRSCYNKRAEDSAYNRLIFAFLGVATPSDLINDEKVTPFNISHAIELKGLELKHIQPLSNGLQGKVK